MAMKLARATVVLARSTTGVLMIMSPDMKGIPGMAQALAAKGCRSATQPT